MKFRSWLSQLFRRNPRVYVLPTRMGGYLNGLIFLMFLLAVGYSSNLLLIFTLLLFSFNLLWVIQTHSALERLKLEHLIFPDGHVGEPLIVSLRWTQAINDYKKIKLTLEGSVGSVAINPLDGNGQWMTGEMTLSRRGQWQWQYLKLSTELPFGLYQVWKYLPVTGSSFAYPALLKNINLPLLMQQLPGEDYEKFRPGSEGFRELSPYAHQEARRISWKHYARSGELLVKSGEETTSNMLEFNLRLPTDPMEKENYLSLLATQLVLCQRQQIPFTFISSQLTLGPTGQIAHLQQCLKVMGLC
jgi:uncharacterized protein (DUF58 family)